MFLFRRVPVAPATEAESADECVKTNILVLGCGPAGLGLLVRAARDEKIDDLVSRTPSIIAAETEKAEDTATATSQTRKKKVSKKYRGKDKEYGLLVVDKASENKVGGGKLLDYLIRSNTASARFVGTVTGAKVSSLQNSSASPNRTNSSDITETKDSDPLSESIGYTLDKEGSIRIDATSENTSKSSSKQLESKPTTGLTRRESSFGDVVGDGGSLNSGRCEALMGAVSTTSGVKLIQNGKYHVPLNLVGQFFADAAAPAVKTLLTKGGSTGDLIHSCEAESASIEEDGTFTVVVKQVNEQNDRTQMDSTDVGINRYKIKCNHLVLAMGGKQVIPKWLPSSVRPTAMVIRSDYLLTQKGLDKVVAHLRKSLEFPTVRNRENAPLVCIIGGSHSAFSSAWLLLNGPAHGKLFE